MKREGKPKEETGQNLSTVLKTGLQTVSKCSRTNEKQSKF